MGSWNGTCGISQQSVSAYEKVVAYVILFNSAVYSNHNGIGVAQPISFPIHGKYDDGGSIENVVDTFGARSTVALFNQWHTEKRLSVSGRDTLPAQFKSVEEIFAAIQEGLYVTLPRPFGDREPETRELGFMLNLKSASLSAWETIENSTQYDLEGAKWDKIFAEVQSVIDLTINVPSMTLGEVEAKLAKLMTSGFANVDKKQIHVLFEMRLDLMDETGFRSVWGKDNENILHRFENACQILHHRDAVHTEAFKTLFNITKATYTVEQNDDIKTTIAQFIMNHYAMWVFRKNWSPQGHTSQFDTLKTSIEFMKRQLKRIEARLAEKAADYDDDDYVPNTIEYKADDYEIAVV